MAGAFCCYAKHAVPLHWCEEGLIGLQCGFMNVVLSHVGRWQVVRAPVALAMVKLLKLLPEEAMIQQLPQALQGVAHLLRNRLQRIR